MTGATARAGAAARTGSALGPVIPATVLCVTLGAVALLGSAPPAAASGTSTVASPTPTVPALVAGSPATNRPVSWPVVDLAGPVADLAFGEASADGAVQDLGGKEFRLAADVLFAFDKAALNPRARTELAAIAGKLKAAGVTRLAITGYTDSTGSDAYNLRLSRGRAASVRAYLATGLGPGVTIVAAGRGESDPVADNRTKRGQALNRRVVIAVR